MASKDIEKRRVYQKQYYKEHKEEKRLHYLKFREEILRRQNKYYQANKARFRGYAGQVKSEVLTHYSKNGQAECTNCGITDVDVLTIDHINEAGYSHRKIAGLGINFYRWLKKNNYPEGYQTLCFNCNIKKHIQGGNYHR